MNAPLPLNVTQQAAGSAYETVARVSNEVAGRLAARLASEAQGEVLFSGADRGRYATDASIYQVMPVGVFVPRSANTRRMVETAAHLTDHVFPRLPVRQWVLSVPKRLRYFMQRDGAVLNMVLRIFLRVISQSLQSHCPGAAQVDKAALHWRNRFHPPVRLQPERACSLPRLCGRWRV